MTHNRLVPRIYGHLQPVRIMRGMVIPIPRWCKIHSPGFVRVCLYALIAPLKRGVRGSGQGSGPGATTAVARIHLCIRMVAAASGLLVHLNTKLSCYWSLPLLGRSTFSYPLERSAHYRYVRHTCRSIPGDQHRLRKQLGMVSMHHIFPIFSR